MQGGKGQRRSERKEVKRIREGGRWRNGRERGGQGCQRKGKREEVGTGVRERLESGVERSGKSKGF